MERERWEMLLFLLLMLLLWLWLWRCLLGGGDGAGTLAPPLNGYLCSYGRGTRAAAWATAQTGRCGAATGQGAKYQARTRQWATATGA
ncbi:hypothetical protein V8C35DRAFT_43308 [Trichoderma chlorosporum]